MVPGDFSFSISPWEGLFFIMIPNYDSHEDGKKGASMRDLGKILIADHEESFRLATSESLRREGYTCDGFGDVGNARNALREGEYDLMIADLEMPGNFDLELIRDLPHLVRGLPAILVTARPSWKTAADSLRLPVLAYLTKPIQFESLLGPVRKGVEKFHALKAVRGIHNRLVGWEEAARKAQISSPELRLPSPTITMDSFLTITLQNLVGSMSNLKDLAQSLSSAPGDRQVCHLLTCPRLLFLRKGVEEIIEVLEKTKGSFKSKELGELRRKLERIIKSLS